MSDQQGERLEYVLTQLEEGHMSTPDAARLVREMHFPAPQAKTAYQATEADATGDPDVPQSGSFFPVSHAYAMGRITRAQYDALAAAASGT